MNKVNEHQWTNEERDRSAALQNAWKEAHAAAQLADRACREAERKLFEYNRSVSESERCAAVVRGSWTYRHRCERARGYGKDGLYCKQHAKKYPAEHEGDRDQDSDAAGEATGYDEGPH